MGKIFRFNKKGLLTQSQYPKEKSKCFTSSPKFITENYNGDVVVSALNQSSPEDKSGAVIVTDQSGNFFIYIEDIHEDQNFNHVESAPMHYPASLCVI